jgi:hypothetical protein
MQPGALNAESASDLVSTIVSTSPASNANPPRALKVAGVTACANLVAPNEVARI